VPYGNAKAVYKYITSEHTFNQVAVEAAGQAERVKFENYPPDLCGSTPSLNN
jgi:hypothetical protein